MHSELVYLDGSLVTAHVDEATDVLVVGTGAGGASTASVLSEAGLLVTMVEEGPYVTGARMTGKPLDMFKLLYRNGGLTGTMGLPPISVPLGRCVGGTTTVNSGTCYRAPASVLQRWETEFGVEEATQLAPHYDEVQADIGIKPVPDEWFGPHARRFQAATEAMGYKGSRIPRNEKGCVATGVCALGCPQDGKQAMSVSYVPRAIAAGARLFTNARVDQILFDGDTAIGVRGRFLTEDGAETGRTFRVLARHVVVAAGALHTPALLLRSRLPVTLPRLGRNLHLHPATRVLARFADDVNGWGEVPQSYNVDQFVEDGIFIQGQFVPPAVQSPNVPGVGLAHQARMEAFQKIGSFGALISDVSSGRVFANGLAWYRLNRVDTEKLRRAIALTAEIFLRADAREVYTGIRGQAIVRNQADLNRLQTMTVKATDIEMMAFHPMGTCAIGKTGAQGVTDAYGRVFGVRNLSVADTSLFPTSNKVNPQFTLMALAVRNAKVLAGALAPSSKARLPMPDRERSSLSSSR